MGEGPYHVDGPFGGFDPGFGTRILVDHVGQEGHRDGGGVYDSAQPFLFDLLRAISAGVLSELLNPGLISGPGGFGDRLCYQAVRVVDVLFDAARE